MAKNDPDIVRVEDLLGRRVRTMEGAVLGRIEEIRATRAGEHYEVAEYHLGTGALLERLGLVSRILGREPRTYIVKWDQLDLDGGRHPRLTCDVADIKKGRRERGGE